METIKTMAEFAAAGKQPEFLFWVGCAGSFDDRHKKVTRAFAEILQKVGISFAVLGTEESCTGDPARRAGNEFLFQMQAMSNIEVLNLYAVKKIVTACPHCFNTLKNEYPTLGGNYEVIHHSQLLAELISSGKIKASDGSSLEQVAYHDSCYLGRGNGVYEAPREIIAGLKKELIELKSCRTKGLCCGAGGAQVFKEPEAGGEDVQVKRVQEMVDSGVSKVALACPFCMVMVQDGLNKVGKEKHIQVVDLAELVQQSM
ncbi:(Fe-S)-binding protein [Aquirufa antheringensis]|uniref:(Fe-S)-binding protein n=1 Tax=Aquirufa antheringensis TaxID=2516559 RepID=UPI00208ECD47|nr:(Fe-S)-binding protein [Aquirufa antheringensis]MCZ2487587.1 (Fe-S)-binding protein [Aquirufa antheringensis]MCZ2489588.1 (Fe-S)-binding protein [Aquirufa antheringensis]USQ02851.1 (Fe-S)-binding protein [Aquirufa antheringensis]